MRTPVSIKVIKWTINLLLHQLQSLLGINGKASYYIKSYKNWTAEQRYHHLDRDIIKISELTEGYTEYGLFNLEFTTQNLETK